MQTDYSVTVTTTTQIMNWHDPIQVAGFVVISILLFMLMVIITVTFWGILTDWWDEMSDRRDYSRFIKKEKKKRNGL